jgi:hypothetical protein
MSIFSVRNGYPGPDYSGNDRVFAADTADLDAERIGIFVHPLFNMAAVKDFPHDSHRRPEEPSHLVGGHSFADTGGNGVVGGRDGANGKATGQDQNERAETGHGSRHIGLYFVILSNAKDLVCEN